jgi:hypothetical protein
MARMVGAMTPTLSPNYRRLAQSLDVVASLILVTAGEALASLGMGGGRALLPAPASELTARRDAVLAALRNLTGATENALDQTTWPYGLHGLREVLRRLETSGHADLRALLEVKYAGARARRLDRSRLHHDAEKLACTGCDRASHGAAIAATDLGVELSRSRHGSRGRPPVASFLEALQLLVDGFALESGGYRLLFVCAAPLVFYGLYGISGPDPATRRLLDVVALRGRLANFSTAISLRLLRRRGGLSAPARQAAVRH